MSKRKATAFAAILIAILALTAQIIFRGGSDQPIGSDAVTQTGAAPQLKQTGPAASANPSADPAGTPGSSANATAQQSPTLNNDQAISETGSGGPAAAAPAPAADSPPNGDRPIDSAATLLSQRHDMTDPETRARIVEQLKELDEKRDDSLEEKARRLGIPISGTNPDGSEFVLYDFDGEIPVYIQTENANAAISTAADKVRDTAPYSVDGASVTIGMWEVFEPRVSHQAFTPSRLQLGQGSSGTSNHATHVAGTLIGNYTAATEGMAPDGQILSYTASGDLTEMTSVGAAAPNEANSIYLSNHSYGFREGWDGNVWYGRFSNDGNPLNDVEDEFGLYSSNASAVDGMAYNLPYYLPFFSSGNHRNDGPPSTGSTWFFGSSSFTYDPSQHPRGDGQYKNGYDTCEGNKVSKNVMTVGAVNDAVLGTGRNIPSASITSFSSTGPTDDGRIKPDIVANGASLLSAAGGSNTATTIFSGTSMASPNAAGSAALLIDYYSSRFPGGAMMASTLKGLIIHTADDLGTAGPDYRFGWGLMNTETAAELIKVHADNGVGDERIIEDRLTNSAASKSWNYRSDGTEPVRVTVCWTDPAGTSKSGHDNRSKALVNDLNLKLVGPGETHLPWVMPHVGDWSTQSLDDAATLGVNTVDNVEQVYLAAPAAGDYTITVDHAGSLTNSLQDFSIIISGMESISSGLSVNPLTPFNAQGKAGGPFAPSVKGYSLTNIGNSSLNWTATESATWLSLSQTSGTLAAGNNVTVNATINSSANSLLPGTYNTTISFTNTNTGEALNASVQLEVLVNSSLPFTEDFEEDLGDEWTLSGTGNHRFLRIPNLSPYQGSYHLLMDGSPSGSNYRNEFTLEIDLSGAINVELSFWAREFNDERHAPPSVPFTGGSNFDGVAISEDGNTWYAVFGFPSSFADNTEFTVNLDDAIDEHGLTYNSNFYIRFNHYGRSQYPNDGIVIDQISIQEIIEPDISVETLDGTPVTNNTGEFDFPDTAVSSTSAAMTFRINNDGLENLEGLSVLVIGEDVAEFSAQNLGANTLAPGASTTFDVFFSPEQQADHSANVFIASNDPDENPFIIPIAGLGYHTLQSWRFQHFGTNLNSGSAADLYDFSGDGIVNLLAFAIGVNPRVPEVFDMNLQRNGSNIEVTYNRTREAVEEGITFVVEWSETLTPSSWSTVGVVESVIQDTGEAETVKVTIPEGVSKPRFVRLRIVKP